MTICGCLGRDPDLRYGTNNLAFVTLPVATNRRVKGADGNYQSITDWNNVVAFGKTAETIAEYLHKGSPIWVRGRLQTRKFKDKTGADRWVTEVICENFQFVQSAKDRAEQQQAEPCLLYTSGSKSKKRIKTLARRNPTSARPFFRGLRFSTGTTSSRSARSTGCRFFGTAG